MKRRLIFRDALGRFVKASERYTKKVKSVQVVRDGEYITVAAKGQMTPERLANVTTRTEFESLPEAREQVKSFTSSSKYKAWDIAEQIDKSRGIRRQLLRVTMDVTGAGKGKRKITFYHNITSNKKRSYQLFRRMNDALATEGLVLYSKVGGRMLPDRRGKQQIKLESVQVEKVI